MIKRVSLVRRRRGMAREAFVRHWLGPHAEIARQVPGIRGYVILLAEDPEACGYDGVAITWFDTREEAETGFRAPVVADRLAADRPEFLEDVTVFLTEEHVVLPPPTPF
jgi:uncharacterized protein (TIGR02118 family)